MNREVNDGYKINRQVDTLPLLGLINDRLEKEDYLMNILANELQVNKEEILNLELGLYEYEKGSLIGMNERNLFLQEDLMIYGWYLLELRH